VTCFFALFFYNPKINSSLLKAR